LDDVNLVNAYQTSLSIYVHALVFQESISDPSVLISDAEKSTKTALFNPVYAIAS